jgi:hypothetical protein
MSGQRSGFAGFIRVNGVYVTLGAREERALQLFQGGADVPACAFRTIWPNTNSLHKGLSALRQKLAAAGKALVLVRGLRCYRLVNRVAQ